MLESLHVSMVLPVDAKTLYEAWLDSAQHSAFTGGKAEIDPNEGGVFTAWDGYIQGRNERLEPFHHIVQSWRTVEFPPGSADSRLELSFETVDAGTRVSLTHSDIPAGDAEKYRVGWKDHYLEPMRAFFAGG